MSSIFKAVARIPKNLPPCSDDRFCMNRIYKRIVCMVSVLKGRKNRYYWRGLSRILSKITANCSKPILVLP